MGTRLSCFGCGNKNGGHFTRFKRKNWEKKQLKTWQEQQENSSKGDIIWRIFAELDKPKRALSKMNLNEIVLYDERMKDGGFKAR